jgi:hypothetical protein
MKSVCFHEIDYDEMIVMEDYKRASTKPQTPQARPTWRKPRFLEEYKTFTKYVNRKAFKIRAKSEVNVKIYDLPHSLFVRTNSYRGSLTVKNTSNKSVYFDKYTILESLLTDYKQLQLENFMII